MKITAGKKAERAESGFGFRSFISGILMAYLITLPVFAIFALILCFVEFPMTLISPVVIITTILSLLAAGWLSSRGIRRKGWLNGALAGLVYTLVLYIIGSIVLSDFTINRYVITSAVMSIVAGAIGGIAGTNFGQKTYKKKLSASGYSKKLLYK